MTDSTVDTTGWTVYSPDICECISSKVATINTTGGNKHVFILELHTNGGRDVVKFLNTKKLPSGNFSVSKDSDFAKLYRLSTGQNPSKRFCRAQQLLKDFYGVQFTVTYEEASTSTTPLYFKATKLEPVTPVVTDEWTGTGQLKGKKRGSYKTDKERSQRRQTGDELAISWRNNGDNLAIEKAGDAHSNLVSGRNSIPYKHTEVSIRPLTHKELITDKDGEVVGARYEQWEGESLTDYYDRVIEETF